MAKKEIKKRKSKKEKVKSFKEIKVPMKFDIGTMRYIPDLEKLKDKKWKKKKSSKPEK